MMQIRLIDPLNYIQEIEKLAIIHKDEMSQFVEIAGERINPDWLKYADLIKQELLFAFGVFDKNKMVGYLKILGPIRNIHHKGLIDCITDTIFVHPDNRKGLLGVKLIRKGEKESKSRGAMRLLINAKPGSPLSFLLPKIGYKLQDLVFDINLKG